MYQETRYEDYRNSINDDELLGKVDLIISDSPYNLNVDYWDENFNFEEMLTIYKQLLKQTGSVIIFNTLKNIELIEELALKTNFKVHSKMVWVKTNPNPRFWKTHGYTQYDKEWMIWLSKSNNPKFKLLYGDNYHSGIFNYPAQQGKHISAKPLPLIEELMLMHSNINDLVLEPFGGSFPVSEIAKKLNRNCISYEIEETL